MQTTAKATVVKLCVVFMTQLALPKRPLDLVLYKWLSALDTNTYGAIKINTTKKVIESQVSMF